MKTKSDKLTAILSRIKAKPADHRLWKKLLRLSAESGRNYLGFGNKTDPCMTTAADKAARKCARRYARLNGVQ